VEILPSEQGLGQKIKAAAEAKQPLIIKAGFDPTAPDIHLGHTVLLRKLRHFQELGHKVVFLIGDYTAMIGDPSGVSKTRPRLTKEEVAENADTYKKQISRVLDIDKLEIRFNSEWFNKMDGTAMMELMSSYSAIRILERDDFANRFKQHKPIRMHEFLYPLLQAYDSVALKADIEVGGTDQKFNMLMGRDIQEHYGQKLQIVVTMPLLEGLDGVQKMSKSLNNYIGINEPPKEMFGKIMSVSDEMMLRYYELLTDMDMASVKDMHPMEAKKDLAGYIVKQYHGEAEAKKARAHFEQAFQKQDPFTGMKAQEFDVNSPDGLLLAELFSSRQMLNLGSKSEFRRLVEQGAIEVNSRKISDFQYRLEAQKEYQIKAGKARFYKIIINIK
jgi:tyrosyl-tRNA synthetase